MRGVIECRIDSERLNQEKREVMTDVIINERTYDQMSRDAINRAEWGAPM